MSKLTKKDIERCENLGWSVEETEDGYFLENYSPAGGDMTIEEKTKEDIITHCENFDAEEEFNLWWGAKRGEPQTPSALWEDCLEQGKMYEELAKTLKEEN